MIYLYFWSPSEFKATSELQEMTLYKSHQTSSWTNRQVGGGGNGERAQSCVGVVKGKKEFGQKGFRENHWKYSNVFEAKANLQQQKQWIK